MSGSIYSFAQRIAGLKNQRGCPIKSDLVVNSLFFGLHLITGRFLAKVP